MTFFQSAAKGDSVSPELVRYFGHANPATIILLLCVIIVLVNLIGSIVGLVTNMLFVRVSLSALLQLRTDLYAYLQSLPLKYHDARRSSDSSFRVAYDSQSVQTIYNRGLTNIFGSVLTLAQHLFRDGANGLATRSYFPGDRSLRRLDHSALLEPHSARIDHDRGT